jgi:hypothetical protein
LEDDVTSGEVRTAIIHGVAQFEGQRLPISILDDTNDPRALEVDVGESRAHAA